MTDVVLQKLEEKIIILLAELEDLRFEVQQLKKENANFALEKMNYTQKLQGLISLLDSIDGSDKVPVQLTMRACELEEMKQELAPV
jgi:regulator of replication initiation timing